MAYIPVAPKAVGAAVDDPLANLQSLKDPSSVSPEQSHYLMKLLLARLPQNRKVELSVHLYQKALDLMDQHNLWGMLLPFVPCFFKYHHSVNEDPLLKPYRITDSVQCFYLLKLLARRLPICDRAKVTYPLLVLAIVFMHQNRLWHELSLFNPSLSTLMSCPMGLKSILSSDFMEPHVDNQFSSVTLPKFNNEQTVSLYKASQPQSVGYGGERDGQYSPSTSQGQPLGRGHGSPRSGSFVGRVNESDSSRNEWLYWKFFGKPSAEALNWTPPHAIPQPRVSSNGRICLLCAASDHSMVNCPEPHPVKIDRIRDLKLCARCLSPAHLASLCTRNVVCSTCGHDHFDYIHHNPTDWTFNQRRQASVTPEQVTSRQRRMSQVSNVSTHYDMTNVGGDNVQTPKQYLHESILDSELSMPVMSCNTSHADLEDLLSLSNRSDPTIPIRPIATQQPLMSFDED